jgi:hypothetical protein
MLCLSPDLWASFTTVEVRAEVRQRDMRVQRIYDRRLKYLAAPESTLPRSTLIGVPLT